MPGGALPEALDDSEKRSRLVLGGIGTEDEGLGSSEKLASPNLALGALESKGDLLSLLGLLSEDGLGLATESLLLGSVASGALGLLGVLALLVLSNLEFHVLLALAAVRVLLLGSMHLHERTQ